MMGGKGFPIYILQLFLKRDSIGFSILKLASDQLVIQKIIQCRNIFAALSGSNDLICLKLRLKFIVLHNFFDMFFALKAAWTEIKLKETVLINQWPQTVYSYSVRSGWPSQPVLHVN